MLLRRCPLLRPLESVGVLVWRKGRWVGQRKLKWSGDLSRRGEHGVSLTASWRSRDRKLGLPKVTDDLLL